MPDRILMKQRGGAEGGGGCREGERRCIAVREGLHERLYYRCKDKKGLLAVGRYFVRKRIGWLRMFQV